MPSETLEFQIEQIYSSRISEDGETEYHIKWAGFDKSESTWEVRIPIPPFFFNPIFKILFAPQTFCSLIFSISLHSFLIQPKQQQQ